ncbi:heparinase II/III domain-containing protein [Paenibacillus cymbidii]|uniref:heparinase II/III domain-containing protein n=1 Tax=Paenibacillus cymbidii TaxID=1639034 RepID=UPI001081F957|nr:heparinase II/III family protein [Paenibacillus cymbidii]
MTHEPFNTESYRVWDTAADSEIVVPLPPAGDEAVFLALPLVASRKSMLFVAACVRDAQGAAIHQTDIVVEWSGPETLHLLIPEQARRAAHTLALKAGDYTFAGTTLQIGRPVWLAQKPPIAVNAGESLLDIFTSGGYYDAAMWQRESLSGGAGVSSELKRGWNYAILKLNVPLGEPGGAAAYARAYDHDIGDCQALIVCASVVQSLRFGVSAEIDGSLVPLIVGRQGAGTEEMRVPIAGRRLTRIVVHAEAEAPGDYLAHLYWFMLERKGAEPGQANEVTGMPDIPAPERLPSGLPKLTAGLLFGEEELARLRQSIADGAGRRFYEEIVAEAEANADYRPESYVGTYFPVYWANQGVERASSPNEETRKWFSTLVYNGLVYLLSGDLKHGLLARRALLAAISCREWCGGFICRIPRGITGYRATFIESHVTQAVALAYDFVGSLLSDEEMRTVEDAVYEKSLPALDMYLRRNREGYLLNSNQGAVYGMGIVYACLVAGRSHPDVRPILERQSAWLRRMLGNYFKPDGTTGEGMMYWEYTTHYAVESLLLLSRHHGAAVAELAPSHLKESMSYVQHMRSLDGGALSFLPLGDCRAERFRFMGPSLLFFARYYADPAAHWMWSNYYDVPHLPGSSFFGAEESTGQYTSNGLLTLLLHEEREAAAPELPDFRRFDCDRIFWRTGSAESDILVFFEGGKQTFEHTHFDKGHFAIQAFGDYVAADPGMLHYDKPEHVQYVRSTYHNIATIRGANQSYRDAEHAVVLRECEDGEDVQYLLADLANSYKELERYDRTLLFVRPHYVVVLDELAAAGGGMEWNFHSRGAFRAAGPGCFVAEGAKAGLALRYACDVPLRERLDGYRDDERNVTHKLELCPDPAATAMNIAAIIAPYPLAGSQPSIGVTCEPVTGGAAFTVSGPWGSDRVIVRLGQRQPVWQGEPTAGRVTVVRDGADGGIGSWKRSFG